MAYILRGTRNADIIRGGAGDDDIAGLGGADSLLGNGGNDIFRFARAADMARLALLDGGDGIDTLVLEGNGGALPNLAQARNLEALTLTGSGSQSLSLAAGSEAAFTDGLIKVTAPNAGRLVLNAALVTAAGRLDVTGTAGADVITTGAGDDSIAGNGGTDVILAGAGDDLVVFANAAALARAARVDGGEGEDRVRVEGNVRQTLALTNLNGLETLELAGTGAQAVVLKGYAGLAFTDAVAHVTTLRASSAKLDASQFVGKAQRLLAETGDGNDSIIGSDNADTVLGHGGADSVLGNGGDDLLAFDSLDNLLAATLVDGGAGTDTVRIGGDGSATLAGGQLAQVERLEFTGSGDLTLSLKAGLANSFTGQVVNIAATSAASLRLEAEIGKDGTLVATGGAGNDTFNATVGTDSFTGGAGDDRFVFSAGAGLDVVTDFQPHGLSAPATVTMGFDEFGYGSNMWGGGSYQGYSVSNLYVTNANYNSNFSGVVSSGANAATIGSYGYWETYANNAYISRAESFDLVSLDVGPVYGYYGWSGYFAVYGYDAAGNQVASYGANYGYGRQHLELGDSFHNLSSIRLYKGNGQIGLDSIVLRDAIPSGEIAHDQIHFAGMTEAQVAEVLAHAGEVNGDTHLFYNGGADELILRGVSLSQLSLTDFAWG